MYPSTPNQCRQLRNGSSASQSHSLRVAPWADTSQLQTLRSEARGQARPVLEGGGRGRKKAGAHHASKTCLGGFDFAKA